MEIKKTCFKCKKTLKISNFYVHKQMADGHLNKCKNCTKKETQNNEKKLRLNPEWVEKEKSRQRKKYYALGYKDLHKPSTDKKREAIKRHNQKFPEKVLSRKYTEIFLTKVNGFNLHHWSYNQEHWLDVIELTIKDHSFLHRYIIYDQERMMYRGLDGILLDSKEKHLNYFETCKLNYEY